MNNGYKSEDPVSRTVSVGSVAGSGGIVAVEVTDEVTVFVTEEVTVFVTDEVATEVTVFVTDEVATEVTVFVTDDTAVVETVAVVPEVTTDVTVDFLPSYSCIHTDRCDYNYHDNYSDDDGCINRASRIRRYFLQY